jgi:hypothetical protein
MKRKQAERRKVEMSDGPPRRLENLWFVYGNHGPKTTVENHGFIQGLLERGQDGRDFYRPTEQCPAAVDAVLAMKPGRDR